MAALWEAVRQELEHGRGQGGLDQSGTWTRYLLSPGALRDDRRPAVVGFAFK
jgi:hypothetical protein